MKHLLDLRQLKKTLKHQWISRWLERKRVRRFRSQRSSKWLERRRFRRCRSQRSSRWLERRRLRRCRSQRSSRWLEGKRARRQVHKLQRKKSISTEWQYQFSNRKIRAKMTGASKKRLQWECTRRLLICASSRKEWLKRLKNLCLGRLVRWSKAILVSLLA